MTLIQTIDAIEACIKKLLSMRGRLSRSEHEEIWDEYAKLRKDGNILTYGAGLGRPFPKWVELEFILRDSPVEWRRKMDDLRKAAGGSPDSPTDPYKDYREGPGGEWLTTTFCKVRFGISKSVLSKNVVAKRTRIDHPLGRKAGRGDHVYRYDVISLIANQKSREE